MARLQGAVLSLISFVVLLMAWREADACSCELKHPQNVFCESDFVYKATVQGVFRNYDEVDGSGEGDPAVETKYVLDIIETLKAPVGLSVNESQYAYGPSRMSACYINLEGGTTYVLMGRVEDGMAYLSMCNYHREWDTLTSRMMRGYRYLYAQHCSCQVETKYSPRVPDETEEVCEWYIREDPSFCYATEGLCKRVDGACKWSRTDPFRACMAGVTGGMANEVLLEP